MFRALILSCVWDIAGPAGAAQKLLCMHNRKKSMVDWCSDHGWGLYTEGHQRDLPSAPKEQRGIVGISIH